MWEGRRVFVCEFNAHPSQLQFLGMKLLSDSTIDAPRRIFIDASYTLGSGKSSGIERVVRNLASQCQAMSAEQKLPTCQLVVSYQGKFLPVDAAGVETYRRTARMHQNVLGELPQGYRLTAGTLCSALPLRSLRKWLLPEPGHLGMFKLWHSAREAMVRRSVARAATPIQAQPGDLFILPDAYWVNRLRNTVWPACEEVREAGGKVATVLYDLIPVTHPEFVGRERSTAFMDYLVKVAANSDLIVAISNTVRDQARDFLGEIQAGDTEFHCGIESFELGCEINTTRQGKVRPEVKAVFDSPKSPYLTVSTFDPRKNHGYLLDAFEQMWASSDPVSLCLVGRFGSRCDGTVRRIQSHPLLGKNLFLFNDLSDAELQYCYRKTRGVVFPSIVEGFGLPIVEALSFGQKTFASDTKIHREVGQADCTYFNLRSPDSLVKALENWESAISRGEDKLSIDRSLTSWRSSAEQFMSQCRKMFRESGNGDRQRAA